MARYCPYCTSKIEKGDRCTQCNYAGTYVPKAHHIPPGTVLNRKYLVGRVLGEGGFGITYVGRDLTLDTKIAIKEYFPSDKATRDNTRSTTVSVNKEDLEGDYLSGKEKFITEAKTIAKMQKQNAVVTVHEYFEANASAYIVMEYVEGNDLKQIINERGSHLETKETLELLKPVFGALESMHDAGIIHRDISPDNIMVDRDGTAKLIDFGLAKDTGKSNKTVSANIALKHSFSPIEQYQGKNMGPWTDVYAMGATIYYCITGKLPPNAMDRLVKDEIKLPNALGAKLDPKQQAALMKALAVKQEDRFKSMSEFEAALYYGAIRTGPKPGVVAGICVAAAAALAIGIFAMKKPDPDNIETIDTTPVSVTVEETAAPEIIEQKSELIGQTVIFGKYEQDGDESNGKEDIEWQVLDVQDGKALIISKYALDGQLYNDELSEISWETSTLREWLNWTFLNSAFSSSEQECIATTKVAADKNPQHSTDPGSDTSDKIFLLSITEAEKYFPSDNLRRCAPTHQYGTYYSHSEDWSTAEVKISCSWWLRSPGRDQDHASFVSETGSINYGGKSVNDDYDGYYAIRPALWIDLNSYEEAVAYEIGDIITFGKYEQDGDTSNGKEDIEWQVLDIQDGKALLISKYALDCQQYNTSDPSVTWETCELREWLNGTFLNSAFSSDEQELIAATKVTNDNDKVFLLSITEAEKYFSSDNARLCAPTAYAISQGANYNSSCKTAEGKAACWWWLRSPATPSAVSPEVASFIDVLGQVYDFGDAWYGYNGAVRPALRLDLNSYEEAASVGEETAVKPNPAYASEPAEEAYEIGDIVSFGKYEQDNDTSDGKEDIEWQVLDVQDGKALLISKYALDCRNYNAEQIDITWEKCTVREWLNGTFLKSAFSTDEQEIIATTSVTADKNPRYSTDPGKPTDDKVFLLSVTEAEKHFSSDSSRLCAPTSYAIAQGVYFTGDYKTAEGKAVCYSWWLRSPGYDQDDASQVDYDGSIGFSLVDDYRSAIRPALWIIIS